MNFLVVAISLGFLGSFHCIGMCGPIAMALPVHNKPPLIKYVLILVYNLGRMLTYSLLGLIAGLIGKSFILAGLQQTLSITIGILLLAYVFLPFKYSSGGYTFFLWIRSAFERVFTKGTQSSLFLIGLLNGLLPCGLVYAGLAGAVATGDILKGSLFMAAFGAGTLPMMLFLPLAGGFVSPSARNKMRKLMPIALSMMALFLILRGLNLGIPYVSPKITADKSMSCHDLYPDPKKMIHCQKPPSK